VEYVTVAIWWIAVAYPLFVDFNLQSPHIWHSFWLYCREETGWWSWLNSTKLLCNVKTNSHFLPCRSCSNSISHLKSAITMRRGFMAWSPSSSPRFSPLAVIFRTTLNKITSRRFQQHLQKKPLCSGIMLHLFPSFRNTIGQTHEANL